MMIYHYSDSTHGARHRTNAVKNAVERPFYSGLIIAMVIVIPDYFSNLKSISGIFFLK